MSTTKLVLWLVAAGCVALIIRVATLPRTPEPVAVEEEIRPLGSDAASKPRRPFAGARERTRSTGPTMWTAEKALESGDDHAAAPPAGPPAVRKVVASGTVERLGREIAVSDLRGDVFRLLREKAGTKRLRPRKRLPTKLDPNVWMQRLQEARSKKAVYRRIGENLHVVDRYFGAADDANHYAALLLAMATSQVASDDCGDAELAVQIYDSFVAANLHLANPDSRHMTSAHNLLAFADPLYEAAGFTEGRVWANENMVRLAPNANAADFARLRLFKIYDAEGEHEKALHWLKQIDENGRFTSARSQIPVYEKKASGLP